MLGKLFLDGPLETLLESTLEAVAADDLVGIEATNLIDDILDGGWIEQTVVAVVIGRCGKHNGFGRRGRPSGPPGAVIVGGAVYSGFGRSARTVGVVRVGHGTVDGRKRSVRGILES